MVSTKNYNDLVKSTHTEISNRTGISVSHISRIMSGDRIPSVRTLKAICKEYGVEIPELMKYLGL